MSDRLSIGDRVQILATGELGTLIRKSGSMWDIQLDTNQVCVRQSASGLKKIPGTTLLKKAQNTNGDILEIENTQLTRVVRALIDKFIKEGYSPREATSKAYAIGTRHLQRHGYLKPGTNQPTEKGKIRSLQKAATPDSLGKKLQSEHFLDLARKGPKSPERKEIMAILTRKNPKQLNPTQYRRNHVYEIRDAQTGTIRWIVPVSRDSVSKMMSLGFLQTDSDILGPFGSPLTVMETTDVTKVRKALTSSLGRNLGLTAGQLGIGFTQATVARDFGMDPALMAALGDFVDVYQEIFAERGLKTPEELILFWDTSNDSALADSILAWGRSISAPSPYINAHQVLAGHTRGSLIQEFEKYRRAILAEEKKKASGITKSEVGPDIRYLSTISTVYNLIVLGKLHEAEKLIADYLIEAHIVELRDKAGVVTGHVLGESAFKDPRYNLLAKILEAHVAGLDAVFKEIAEKGPKFETNLVIPVINPNSKKMETVEIPLPPKASLFFANNGKASPSPALVKVWPVAWSMSDLITKEQTKSKFKELFAAWKKAQLRQSSDAYSRRDEKSTKVRTPHVPKAATIDSWKNICTFLRAKETELRQQAGVKPGNWTPEFTFTLRMRDDDRDQIARNMKDIRVVQNDGIHILLGGSPMILGPRDIEYIYDNVRPVNTTGFKQNPRKSYKKNPSRVYHSIFDRIILGEKVI